MATAVEYPSSQIKPVVSIRDVTHRYGKVLALDRISVEIPTGIMVGIIGPDGAGKSTLLALMAGSKKMQEGKIDVLGGDMRQLRHRRAVCPKIAYMPQGLGKNLYLELSVHDNVDFMAQRVGLSRVSAPLKSGTARCHRAWALSRSSGGKLSGGMKQKVGYAEPWSTTRISSFLMSRPQA
jgi:ribosome-dependent ATPase